MTSETVVYAYEIKPMQAGRSDQVIQMREGARIVSAAFVGSIVYIWALVDRYTKDVDRRIIVVPSAQPVPETATFVGTLLGGGNWAFHIFDGGEVK